jgi:Ser/Thr protein kinase RdoA (MazF antagonist)
VVAARVGAYLADMQRALRIPPRSHKERRDGEYIGALLAERTEMLEKRGNHPESKFLRDAWSSYGAPLIPDLPADHVVHADICPANVVFDGDRLSGFIDFDDAYYGSGITDIAVALMEFSAREDQHLDAAVGCAFIDGFAERAGTRPSGDALLAHMRLNCFRYLSYTLPLTLVAGDPVASNIYHRRLRYLGSADAERLIDNIQ